LNLPPYLEVPGARTYRQPFQLTGFNQQAFLLKASMDRLGRLTDQWLNAVPGSPWSFAPLLPFVICSPVWINRIACTDPEWARMGWMREADFNFGFFVGCHRDGLLEHIAVAIPYLIVDNPVTVATGREVFGYRKVFGQMEYVAGTYQPAAASTWLFREFSPDSELELAEVARVISPPAWGAATRSAEWEDLKQIVERAGGDLLLDAMVVTEHLLAYFRKPHLTNVYVLQVRDVELPGSAAYQALIESPMQITNFNSSWLLPDGYRVRVNDHASYPLVTDLGIEVDANSEAASVLSFQLNFDCVLQPGRVLAVRGRTG